MGTEQISQGLGASLSFHSCAIKYSETGWNYFTLFQDKYILVSHVNDKITSSLFCCSAEQRVNVLFSTAQLALCATFRSLPILQCYKSCDYIGEDVMYKPLACFLARQVYQGICVRMVAVAQSSPFEK